MSEAPVVLPPRVISIRWLWQLLALLLCAGGWYVSMTLLTVSGGAPPPGWLEALCRADAAPQSAGDCESVLRSRFAFVQGSDSGDAEHQSIGMPWAVLGAAYFAFVGVWFLFIGTPSRRQWLWHLVPLLVVLCGAIASTYLLSVMAFELKRWCNGCALVHGMNAALLLITLAAAPWRKERPQRPVHPQLALAVAALLLGLAIWQLHLSQTSRQMLAVGAESLNKRYSAIVNDPEFARWSYSRGAIHDELRGPADSTASSPAVHHVVVFIDFQCAMCARAHMLLSDLQRAYGERLQVDYRHYPLDQACNPHVARTVHPAACAAAQAAEAARQVGGQAGMAAYVDVLYQHQRELDAPHYDNWAREAHLDVAAFTEALTSPAVQQRVSEDAELAEKVGVDAAPALYLDGRKLDFWLSEATWQALLNN